MTDTQSEPKLTASLLALQQGEITEHHIYKKIAAIQKLPITGRFWNGFRSRNLDIMRYGNGIHTRMWPRTRHVSGFIT